MEDQKLKIFVIFHKPYLKFENEIFIPIQVGKKISQFNLNMISNDSGDNISDKNDNYL